MAASGMSKSSKSSSGSSGRVAAEDVSLRLSKLDEVFGKAVGVSMNSINKDDLAECFRDLMQNDKLGNAINKAFINMVSETGASMTASYKDLCIQRDLDDKLRILETSQPIVADKNFSVDESLFSTLTQIKSTEEENLKIAIKNMEAEIKKLNEAHSKLRTNMQNEIASITDEGSKIILAAQQAEK